MRTKMSSSPLISPSKRNDRVHAPDISICLCQKRTLLPAISPSPIGNSRYLPSRIVPSSFEPSTLKVNRWGVLVSWISLLIRRSPCHSPAIEVGRNWRNSARSKVQHALIDPPHRRFSPLSYYGDLVACGKTLMPPHCLMTGKNAAASPQRFPAMLQSYGPGGGKPP